VTNFGRPSSPPLVTTTTFLVIICGMVVGETWVCLIVCAYKVHFSMVWISVPGRFVPQAQSNDNRMWCWVRWGLCLIHLSFSSYQDSSMHGWVQTGMHTHMEFLDS
jgi:hypothetical protein